ncbi:glycoside hydrolase family 10 [Novipirellula caenicola]|uniref:GH10 domain-containing protein n=1 Tax=Novipirellula caenicola TaxID=1536901 RepID=A0ABP9W024_9BACT
MGQFFFDVPETAQDFISRSLWKDAYICGIEGVPWQSRNEFDGSRLTITRGIESSGKLFLTCVVDGVGYCTLNTCSLRPLEEAHLLLLELARGSCYRARIQSDAWERAGLTLTSTFLELMAEGTQRFLDAAQRRGDPGVASEYAIEAISILEQANAELGDSYAIQSVSFRKQRENQLGTLLAAAVVPPSPTEPDHEDEFCAAFNSAAVRLSWADIETDSGRFDYDAAEQSIRWCASKGLRVIGGPLLDFRERLMPHWLYLLEDDFESLLQSVCNFAERTVLKLRGSVQLWNCASGLNTPGPLKLDDEQIMRLAVGILQTVRRNDPNTPAIMMFDQPFGEYLAKHRDAISPLHFADAIARSGLGMAGFGLDVRVNYASGATLPRSAIDFGQMIDRWGTLGLPLLVQLSIPGDRGPDEKAIYPLEPLPETSSELDASSDQLRIASPLIRTLLAKHIVHGIVWDGWSDAVPHVLSHSGLIDAENEPRPLLDYLTRVRRDFLA